jgi:hypothetical protein
MRALVEKTGEGPHELGEEIKRKVIELGFYAPNFPKVSAALVFRIWILPLWSVNWGAGPWR